MKGLLNRLSHILYAIAMYWSAFLCAMSSMVFVYIIIYSNEIEIYKLFINIWWLLFLFLILAIVSWIAIACNRLGSKLLLFTSLLWWTSFTIFTDDGFYKIFKSGIAGELKIIGTIAIFTPGFFFMTVKKIYDYQQRNNLPPI